MDIAPAQHGIPVHDGPGLLLAVCVFQGFFWVAYGADIVLAPRRGLDLTITATRLRDVLEHVPWMAT